MDKIIVFFFYDNIYNYKSFNNFDIVHNIKQIETIFIIACGLDFMNIVQFYLIDDIMRKEEKIRENKLYTAK